LASPALGIVRDLIGCRLPYISLCRAAALCVHLHRHQGCLPKLSCHSHPANTAA
jgi:hypothetical protein